jgi:alkanesulfonate monooxygenase SsuD/methylene tetrahydromethanopterin reductase-like flavin-dependent oxidoreductase (luciferase family)
MAELKLDTVLTGLTDETADLAVAAEDIGLDCVWTRETSHDAFLPHPIIAEHTDEVSHGTRIALSFTRSPMVLAYMGWDLARYSEGRFALGLGTQVKAHNERRFSVDWESPGPRLREAVLAIRHIWRVWQG